MTQVTLVNEAATPQDRTAEKERANSATANETPAPAAAPPSPLTEFFTLDPKVATDDQLNDITNRVIDEAVTTLLPKYGLQLYDVLVLYEPESISRPEA